MEYFHGKCIESYSSMCIHNIYTDSSFPSSSMADVRCYCLCSVYLVMDHHSRILWIMVFIAMFCGERRVNERELNEEEKCQRRHHMTHKGAQL